MSNRYTSSLQNIAASENDSRAASGTQLPDFGELYSSYAHNSNSQADSYQEVESDSQDPNNVSQESLDSNSNYVGDDTPPVRKGSRKLNPTRAQAVFQALNDKSLLDTPKTPVRPDSPGLSDSFDFTQPDTQRGYHSSSLNVLLDTPSSESQYRELVSTPPVIETNYRHGGRLEGSEENVDSSNLESTVDVSLRSESVDDWAEKGAAEKTVSTSSSCYDYKVIRRTVKDFEFGKDIGEGSYSTVVLATDKLTNKKYAVKILDKRHIIKEKKVKYVNIEKHALNRLSGCPGVISLFFTFQDKHSLYFVLDYAANGELLGLIKQYGTLNEDCTRYFGAQMLDAIKYMHDNGVIHRDIKPENVLLDEKYRIQITDFGTAKLLERKKNGHTGEEEDYPLDVRAKSFVGTAEYVSPELLENKYCGKPGDIWAFGCILYQLIAGKPPFKATNEYLTFQKITKLQYAFSAGFPLVLRDLIKQVLVLQPSRRATISQIQKHHFFHDINFDDSDAIWNTPVPELGPYKMTAKSMMKMPTKAVSPKKIIRKPGKKKTAPETESPQLLLDRPELRRTASESSIPGRQQRNYSAASVAAYVLSKQDDDESQTSIANPSASATARKPSVPEYIPGTNILRPVINSRANFSRSSVSQNSGSISNSSTPQVKESKPKPAEVPPISSVELAWQAYLQDPDERILHVGQAIACKQPTEYFERKHKGLIHNAPLKYISQLQAVAKVGGNDSMLTRVAHGSKGGLRSAPDNPKYIANEKDAILEFDNDEPDEKIASIPEDEDDSASPSETKEELNTTNKSSNIGKRFFKKFLTHSEKTDESLPDSASTKSGSSGNGRARSSSFSLDKAKNCTLVVTSHGRFLIFIKEGEPKLVNEIQLNYPFILFKEVVTNHAAKFGKIVPVTGIFAVQAIETTFVFEVDKFEVDLWTSALARSKLAQFERERESKPSPKLMDAPPIKTPPTTNSKTFEYNRDIPSPPPPPPATRKSREGRRSELPKTVSPTNTNQEKPTKQTLDPKSHLMFKSRTKQSKSMRRKPPPPLPTGHINNTGLAKDSSGPDNDTLHAALLAVNNNPVAKVNEDTRRSSFSKSSPTSPTANITYRYQSSSNGKGRITAMNSKLLNRSRNKPQ